jgi:hypothetical protein
VCCDRVRVCCFGEFECLFCILEFSGALLFGRFGQDGPQLIPLLQDACAGLRGIFFGLHETARRYGELGLESGRVGHAAEAGRVQEGFDRPVGGTRKMCMTRAKQLLKELEPGTAQSDAPGFVFPSSNPAVAPDVLALWHTAARRRTVNRETPFQMATAATTADDSKLYAGRPLQCCWALRVGSRRDQCLPHTATASSATGSPTHHHCNAHTHSLCSNKTRETVLRRQGYVF